MRPCCRSRYPHAVLQERLALIEAQGCLALRARAHLLLADTYLRATAPQHLPAVRQQVEQSLTRAVSCCDAAEWWSKGEEAATLLALTRHTCGDVEGRDLAAQKAASFREARRDAAAGIVV